MRIKNVKRQAKNKMLEDAGRFLTMLRAQNGYTLTSAAKQLNMSASYISEIENGIKTPSYETIVKLANLYNVDEIILSEKFGVGVYKSIEDNFALLKLISEIRYDQVLSDEEKQELYEQMYRLYKDYVDKKLKEE